MANNKVGIEKIVVSSLPFFPSAKLILHNVYISRTSYLFDATYYHPYFLCRYHVAFFPMPINTHNMYAFTKYYLDDDNNRKSLVDEFFGQKKREDRQRHKGE